MKIVICAPIYCFNETEEMRDAVGAEYIGEIACDRKHRDDPRIIAIAERMMQEDPCCGLIIVEIPDASTDWRICGEDDHECVEYVLDGEMHYAV